VYVCTSQDGRWKAGQNSRRSRLKMTFDNYRVSRLDLRRGSRPQLSGFDSQLGMVAIKSPLCRKSSLVVLYKMTQSAIVAAGTKELKKPRLLFFPSAMLRIVTIAFLKSRNPYLIGTEILSRRTMIIRTFKHIPLSARR
jgi:hypothetical protein